MMVASLPLHRSHYLQPVAVMTTPLPFPICPLPKKTLLRAIETMKIKDLICFSFTSNFAKNIVGALNLKLYDIKCMMGGDAHHLLFNICKNIIYVTIDFLSENYLIRSNRPPDVVCRLPGINAKAFLNHILETFHYPTIDYFSFSLNTRDGQWIYKVLNGMQIQKMGIDDVYTDCAETDKNAIIKLSQLSHNIKLNNTHRGDAQFGEEDSWNTHGQHEASTCGVLAKI